MKSKATFDLSWDNEPSIKAEIANSEDVWDKIATRFKGEFAHESNLAVVIFHGSDVKDGAVKDVVEIIPMSPFEDRFKNKLNYITTQQMKSLIIAFQAAIDERGIKEGSTILDTVAKAD